MQDAEDKVDDTSEAGAASHPPELGLKGILRRIAKNDGATSRWADMLEELKGDPTRQIVALTELSEYLSFSSEELLLCFPVESFVTALLTLIKEPSNDDGNRQLLACRCLFSLIDILPAASRLICAAGGLPILCSKLLNIEYIDVAEICISIFERLAEYAPDKVVKAGSMSAVLQFLDFFAVPAQRQAVNAAAAMAAHVPPPDVFDSAVRPALPQLTALLQHSDTRVRETAVMALRLVLDGVVQAQRRPTGLGLKVFRRGEEPNPAQKIGEVLESVQPVMGNLALLLDDAPHIQVDGLQVLSLLVHYSDNNARMVLEGDLLETVARIDLLNGDTQMAIGALCVAVSLLPAVHINEFACVLEPQRLSIFTEAAALRFGQLFFPRVLQLHASTVSSTIQALCTSVCLSFCLTCSSYPDHLHASFPPHEFATFLANLLFTSSNQGVLFAALVMVDQLLKSHNAEYAGVLVRHGVVRAAHVLVSREEGPRKSTRLLERLASEHGPHRTKRQVVEAAAHQVLWYYFGAASHSGESTILRALSRVVRMLGRPGKAREALEKLRALLLSPEGISGFEFTCSDAANALVQFLYPDDRSAMSQRLALFAEVLVGSGNDADGTALTELVRLCVSSIQRFENLPLILYPSPTAQSELPAHLGGHKEVQHESPKGRGLLSFLRGPERPGSTLKFLSRPIRLRLVPHEEATPQSAPTELPKCAQSPAQRLRSYLSAKVNWKGGGSAAGDTPSPARRRSDGEIEAVEAMSSPGARRARGLSGLLSRRHSADAPSPGPPSGPLAMAVRERPRGLEGALVHVEPLTTIGTLAASLAERWCSFGALGLPPPAMGDEAEDSCDGDIESPGGSPREAAPNATPNATPNASPVHSPKSMADSPGGVGSPEARMRRRRNAPVLFLGDARLSSDQTLVQALLAQHVETARPEKKESRFEDVLQLSADDDEIPQSRSFASFVWTFPHVLRYRMRDDENEDPLPTEPTVKRLEFVTEDEEHAHAHRGQRDRCAALASGLGPELLRILTLVSLCHVLTTRTQRSALRVSRVVHGLPTPQDFISAPLASKLVRQLSDPLALASRGLPPWCPGLVLACPFLFPHAARRLVHGSCQLGVSRALHLYQSRVDDVRRSDEQIAPIPRRKVRIDRRQLMANAKSVMNLFGASLAVLEIEYVDEVGTGSGPTLEFYTQVADMLRAREPPLFRDPAGSNPLYFHPYPPSFYETPEGSALVESARLLGQIIAKGLLDARLLALDLRMLMTALRGEVTAWDLFLLDPELHRSLASLRGLDAAELDALELDWHLPGYPAVALVPGVQKVVTAENVQEYVDAVAECTMLRSVEPLLHAFRQAFASILDLEQVAALWAPEELAGLLGASEDSAWTQEALRTNLQPLHGYTAGSTVFECLLEAMSTFSPEDRKQFLQFATGAPTLPVGGFGGLKPLLTVVKRSAGPDEEADQVLPSVMTCANYLKLPAYSSLDILKERLGYAMSEGQNAFHLS